jgi:putative DNA-binding protein
VETATPSLLELQHAMRASLVVHDDRGISAHVVPGGFDPAERLDIYRSTFAGVLTTALRLSYPAVERLVGAEFFEGAARVFIEAHPPVSACLDDYGKEFPGFLYDFEPAASLSYLPDVAWLERRVSRALHAPDAELLDPHRLAALAEADRARVRFTPHPSVSLIRTDHPADLIWHAVLEQDDAAISAIDPGPESAWLLVQRVPTGVEVRRMSQAEWKITSALCAGRPLAAALDEAQDFDASALLADHLAAGRFIDFRLSEIST